jgi:Tol biopolymer transport system component
VSRTGNRLAYVRVDDNSDLWKFQPGAQPTTYCSSNSPDYDPQFSPDGTRIAFGSARAGDGAIWVANTDCTNPIRLTQESGTPGSPRWSPDSQRIAYDAQAEDGRSRIFVIDAAGGQSRRLTNNTDDEAIPSWSRDGKWIYFRSLRTGTAEIWRSPANGGEAIQITHSGGSAPWESWDGTTLYYVKINVAWQQLFAVPRQGGPERRVLDSVYAWDYFPVKGGIYYVVRTKSPSSFELRFLDDTTGQTTILNRYESGMAAGLTVSPDGKTIVRTGMRTPGNSDLMLIENFR